MQALGLVTHQILLAGFVFRQALRLARQEEFHLKLVVQALTAGVCAWREGREKMEVLLLFVAGVVLSGAATLFFEAQMARQVVT
jgi:hypothetical protein|tara:strand:+ start:1294 stop:1545 length:252 start_codon:yes stop_codon:yes gene_type:complete